MKVVAVVQARIGSLRLPGKSLKPIAGIAIVEWVFRRLRRCRKLDAVVFAVPESSSDDRLAAFLEDLGAAVVRGSEDDVLGRMHKAASTTAADCMVRICADNPAVSWEAVDYLLESFDPVAMDYAYNHVPAGTDWPDGLGAEVCTRDCLETLHREAREPAEREHVFNFLLNRRERFRVVPVAPPHARWRRPEVSLDVDTEQDLLAFSDYDFTIDDDVDTILAKVDAHDL